MGPEVRLANETMNENVFRKAVWPWSVLLSALLAIRVEAEISPKYYAVEASVSVQTSPPQIMLNWTADPRATGYTIHRKARDAKSWTPSATLPGSALNYVDSSVAVGVPYEYQISKSTSYGYKGYAYLYTGIEAPAVDQLGKVVLIIDKTHATALAGELMRLEQDLIGDGWTVLRRDVSPQDPPPKVKSIIKTEYEADRAGVRAVFLFGHVAVPYSGDFYPDGHPDHKGAWPADVYYGDMDGSWTDQSVHTTSAERARNHNVRGDGKFDQSELPSDVELEVGRVDLSNMTNFANKSPSRSERDLLRQYLNKDHQFRHGRMQVERRGLICDNFGERDGEAFAASGWRNFAVFFGAQNVAEVPGWNYFSTVSSKGHLWSYGTGGGSFYTCNGIGSSDDFARTDTKTVFTMFLGSYFGDWDNESNFLRSPLGSSSYTLTSSWAGRPHWFYHHMALGETIGFSTRLSQNNNGLYAAQNTGTRQVHVALMGDPTLRMHPVIPPSNLQGALGSSGVSLSWQASPDTEVAGYHVYRAESLKGPFTRLTRGGPIAQTAYQDSQGSSVHTYMVRAIKLDRSASGTYYNPSQGIFYSVSPAAPPEAPPIVAPPAVPGPVASVPAKVRFVGFDSTTRGNWKGAYGQDGYHVIGDAVKYPSYAVVTSTGNNRFEWGDSTADARALARSQNNDRVPACWYADSSFELEISLLDGQAHRLALYCVDWDTRLRSEQIQILDSTSGAVLDARILSDFNGGKYLIWDAQGSLKVRVTKMTGNNALAMGLFFDPTTARFDAEPLQRPIISLAGGPRVAQGQFQMRLQGEVGQRFEIQASDDLRNWTPIANVTLATASYDFVDTEARRHRARFYRAVAR